MMDSQGKGVILIVDDTPNNLELLSDTLTQAGFDVAVAIDGETAIEQVEYDPPALILLDVMMPGIDGFETCRQLKANPFTQDIPIIFMTALTDTLDKVKGLNLGAVDYIIKPFQQEEVLARVRVHLKLRMLTQTLEAQNAQLVKEIEQRIAAEAALQKLTEELEEQVEERTAKLAETMQNWQHAQAILVQSEKMSSLGQMIAGVAHEINNPMSSIHGNLTCAKEYIQELLQVLRLYHQYYPDPVTEIQNKNEEIEIEFLQKDLLALLNSMQLGTDRICEIVTSLRNFSRAVPGATMVVDLHQGLDSTLILLQHRLKQAGKRPGIQVIKKYGNPVPVECYPGLMNQVFMNIFTNAIDALEELEYRSHNHLQTANGFSRSDQPTIWIYTEVNHPEYLSIRIIDNGSGMSEEVCSHLFDPFFTTKPFGKGTGLGLSISHEIVVEKHGGKISCTSAPGKGAEFLIEIPIHGCEKALALAE